jgi:hypothetical protein
VVSDFRGQSIRDFAHASFKMAIAKKVPMVRHRPRSIVMAI